MKNGAQTIVLVGMMASGKTTLGRLLASKLGYTFIDTDIEVEQQTGSTVQQLFAEKGEKYFRQLEQDLVLQHVCGTGKVVSLGGGAFINKEIRTAVKDKVTSIWLKVELEELLQRLPENAERVRPLLARKPKEEILRAMLAERTPIYAEADITVEAGKRPPEEIVDKIIEQIGLKDATVKAL